MRNINNIIHLIICFAIINISFQLGIIFAENASEINIWSIDLVINNRE